MNAQTQAILEQGGVDANGDLAGARQAMAGVEEAHAAAADAIRAAFGEG